MVGIKRKSPKEIIEGHDPKIEHIYAKFPGTELIDVTLSGDEYSADHDDKKLLAALNRKGLVKHSSGLMILPDYMDLHNHPVTDKVYDAALPSTSDIKIFLQTRNIKTMAIAQQDAKTGEVQGYLLLRKKIERPPEEKEIGYEVRKHELNRYTYTSDKNPREAMEEISKKYNLQHRWVAARGYELPSERKADVGWRFVKKKSLEHHASAVIGMGSLLVSILFLSNSITSNVIGDNIISTSNWIGAILFLVGIVGAFFYFKRK